MLPGFIFYGAPAGFEPATYGFVDTTFKLHKLLILLQKIDNIKFFFADFS